jgi:hypothetical protein
MGVRESSPHLVRFQEGSPLPPPSAVALADSIGAMFVQEISISYAAASGRNTPVALPSGCFRDSDRSMAPDLPVTSSLTRY